MPGDQQFPIDNFVGSPESVKVCPSDLKGKDGLVHLVANALTHGGCRSTEDIEDADHLVVLQGLNGKTIDEGVPSLKDFRTSHPWGRILVVHEVINNDLEQAVSRRNCFWNESGGFREEKRGQYRDVYYRNSELTKPDSFPNEGSRYEHDLFLWTSVWRWARSLQALPEIEINVSGTDKLGIMHAIASVLNKSEHNISRVTLAGGSLFYTIYVAAARKESDPVFFNVYEDKVKIEQEVKAALLHIEANTPNLEVKVGASRQPPFQYQFAFTAGDIPGQLECATNVIRKYELNIDQLILKPTEDRQRTTIMRLSRWDRADMSEPLAKVWWDSVDQAMKSGLLENAECHMSGVKRAVDLREPLLGCEFERWDPAEPQ
jgi:predicted amino acid-binding ACT domain protein